MELTCKRNKGEFITSNRWILDQISDEDNKWYWSGNSSFRLHLERDYGITIEQYWNIIHGLPMDYHPECPVCGTPVKFHRPSHGGWRRYCCVQCTGANHDTYRARFKAYNYDYAYIYLARTDNPNLIKIGISGAGWRSTYRGMLLYSHNRIIGSSDIDRLLDIEQIMDEEFCIDNSELFRTKDLNAVINKLIELNNESSTTSLYDVQGNAIDLGNANPEEFVKSFSEDIVSTSSES